MATVVTFGPNGIRTAGSYTVYTRSNWRTGTWTEYSGIFVTEVTWAVAPSIPTATLELPYGLVKKLAASAFTEETKDTSLRRVFVKIEVDTDTAGEPRPWFGVIEIDTDQLGGAVLSGGFSTATGLQQFTAYGMEKLLADHTIRDGKYSESGTLRTTDTPPIFNRDGLPNRTKGHVGGTSYVFSDDPDNSDYWTSRTIIEYILTHQTPLAFAGTDVVFFLGLEAAIADWDRPQLEQYGRTTYELISQLLDRRRMVVWNARVDEILNEVAIDAHSMLATPLAIGYPGAGTIPEALQQIHLSFDTDQLTTAAVKATDVQVVDQVIVRGKRRRSVGSFSFSDGTITAGWESADETTYKNGGSQLVGVTGTKELAKRHAEVRARPDLSLVYSFFRIPHGWNRKVRNGEGGDLNPMFPDDTLPGVAAPVFYPDMFIDQTMPLIEGVDYEDAAIADETYTLPEEEQQEMPTLVVFEIPEAPGRWIEASQIGQNAELEITGKEEYSRFSCHVRVPPRSKGFYLDVHGAPRHVLTGSTFPYLDEDVRVGEWSYDGGMIATLCIPDDRYCEGQSAVAAGAGSSVVRVKLINAGDGFKKDYVAPGTVVGVNSDGTLKRSTGGFIPAEGPTDDVAKLTAVADIALEWYSKQRFVLNLRSLRIKAKDDIDLGYLVTEIGDSTALDGHRKTINSTVTEIRVVWPRGTPYYTPDPTFHVVTSAGEIDPFLLLPSGSDESELSEAIEGGSLVSETAPGQERAEP